MPASDSITSKVCPHCGQEKPLDSFYFSRQSGKHRGRCKECYKHDRQQQTPEQRARVREAGRRCYQKHAEARREYLRARAQRLKETDPTEYRRRKREKEKRRLRKPEARQRQATRSRGKLLRRYQMTPDEYDALLRSQGGRCKICGSTDPKLGGPSNFVVDHCHETGRVRGLLCSACNRILGALGDDLAGVMRFVDYLKSAACEPSVR